MNSSSDRHGDLPALCLPWNLMATQMVQCTKQKPQEALEGDGGDGSTTLWTYLMPVNWTLKNGLNARTTHLSGSLVLSTSGRLPESASPSPSPQPCLVQAATAL